MTFTILFVFLFASLVSAVRINEIELNPEGTDSGNEWIELYSEQEISLSGWKLVNSDNQSISLNKVFQNYLIINFSGQWLDNSNEKIILKDSDGEIADETKLLSDSYNDDRTWQYCNGNWLFKSSTKGSANSCSSQNQTQNNTQQNNTNQTPQQEAKISLEAEWEEDEIINGKEFEIEVKAFNLKNENYDIKIYIIFKNNETIISETYNGEEDSWKASSYYVNGILAGVGNKNKIFELRIREKYRDFSGEAKINVKIRKLGTSSIISEIEKDIEILEEEETATKQEEQKNTTETKKIEETNAVEQTSSVIRLGNRNKTQEQKNERERPDESKILYESKSEKIKKYTIYALNLILVVVIIFLLKLRYVKKKSV